ncbi:cobalamin-binding protein [candidate division WOR-3 bacterium]|nr:cobalamin-binding protein [candidate division WOR-3 bacterium]
MPDPGHLYARLADAVAGMQPALVAEMARQVVAQGLPAREAITEGLAVGMRRMGEKFAARECFVPEVLLAAKAMYAGFDILKQAVGAEEPTGRVEERVTRRAALGVVQGDIHDIGKNIVKVMVQAAGFEVADLGRNVPVERFVQAVRDDGVRLLGISSLMTTTMVRMGTVIDALKSAGVRDRVKVLVGGAPVSQEFARRVGADGWAADAHGAVLEFERLARR